MSRPIDDQVAHLLASTICCTAIYSLFARRSLELRPFILCHRLCVVIIAAAVVVIVVCVRITVVVAVVAVDVLVFCFACFRLAYVYTIMCIDAHQIYTIRSIYRIDYVIFFASAKHVQRVFGRTKASVVRCVCLKMCKKTDKIATPTECEIE